MRTISAIAVTILAFSAMAGDEFQLPKLRSQTAYESADPVYRLVGIEERQDGYRAWVVAGADLVLRQASVNRIILSVRTHLPQALDRSRPLEVYFYGAVLTQTDSPAFRISDLLAHYDPGDNKTYFLVGEDTRGGWAYGPAGEK